MNSVVFGFCFWGAAFMPLAITGLIFLWLIAYSEKMAGVENATRERQWKEEVCPLAKDILKANLDLFREVNRLLDRRNPPEAAVRMEREFQTFGVNFR